MRPLSWLFSVIFLLSIATVHYTIDRSNSLMLVLIYTNLFAAYLYLIAAPEVSFRWIMILALCARLTLFFGYPTLSDDFYRFIWDGNMIEAGINPYASTPADVAAMHVNVDGNDKALYQNLNSQNYHSIYPPISQWINWMSIKVGDNKLFNQMSFFRILILCFDLALIALFMLKKGNQSERTAGIYALNPLVILELTGNLHFDGLVAFFVLLSIFYIGRNKYLKAGFTLGLGILTKLTPLMLLPSLIKKAGLAQSIKAFVFIAAITVFGFAFFFDIDTIDGLKNSLQLFFQKFEFNAGLFFLIRAAGIQIKGYDLVHQIGPALSAIALIGILFYSLVKVNKDSNMARVFSVIILIQLVFATTVHPWYIVPLIALSAWSGFIFPVIWSFFIFLSYRGYTTDGYEHQYAVMLVEYLAVVPLAIYEIIKNKQFVYNLVRDE